MHELSIAAALIDAAQEAARAHGGGRIVRIRARVGPLSGVVPEALAFAFDVAAADAGCGGAALDIESTPLRVRCDTCNAERVLDDDAALRCPDCGEPTPHVIGGRELELCALELES